MQVDQRAAIDSQQCPAVENRLGHVSNLRQCDTYKESAISCRYPVMPTSLDAVISNCQTKRIAIRLFVDSSLWHRYWHCHRLPSRSFSLNGRQFHICSRCTGIALGTVLAPIGLLLPSYSPVPYASMLGVFLADGLTQSLGLRVSRNSIRFVTGLLAPVAMAALTMTLIR